MSQLGIFNNFDEDTILSIQQKQLELFLEGKTIMKSEGEGTSVEREFTMRPSDVLEECKYSLQQKWPDKYGYPVNNIRQYRIA